MPGNEIRNKMYIGCARLKLEYLPIDFLEPIIKLSFLSYMLENLNIGPWC
jgi:hypothetical protein